MKQDDVKAIAQGRVWTGNDALNNGLVDELGGLDVALKYATEAAQIEEIAGGEFEREPVPKSKLKGWKSFIGIIVANK